MSDRTFKLQQPHMEGTDISIWQQWCNKQMTEVWNINYTVNVDGDYGQATRDITASICHGIGLSSAAEAMQDGVTPELRIKLRNKNLSSDELARFREREPYRDALRRKWDRKDTAPPLLKIVSSSWGYHPPVHDGVDLICLPNADIFAICTGKVVRVWKDDWWGKGAPKDENVKSKGDGIIVIQCGINAGPFRKGLYFGYGHAENACVKVGDSVNAGDRLGKAGLANAWHVHFMVTDDQRNPPGGTGDRDPMPFVNYACERD